MIKSVRLQNFFSFRDESFELHPDINLLVGINGSGKSNFIKALHLLHATTQTNDDSKGLQSLLIKQWGGYENIKHLGITAFRPISLEFVFDHERLRSFGFAYTAPLHFLIEIHPVSGTQYFVRERLYQPKTNAGDFFYFDFSNGKGRASTRSPEEDAEAGVEQANINFKSYEGFDSQASALSAITDEERFLPIVTVRKAIKSLMAYESIDVSMGSAIRRGSEILTGDQLKPNGSNLAPLLNQIGLTNKRDKGKILEQLKNVNPHFINYEFKQLPSLLFLMLEESSLNASVPVTHISDGTLRFLCWLAIFYNSNRGHFIAMDEPERGLHPDMISTVAEGLEYASKTSQLVVATHSDYLLDKFMLEHLRVFEKDEHNGTVVRQFKEDDFKGWYEDYAPLGNRWRDGDLGGNRY